MLSYSNVSSAQNAWLTSFPINTKFVLGESRHYAVNEFFKIDNLFIGIKSTIQSTVHFRVIDTADGGYWIKYSVNVNSAKANKDSSVYITATLTDNIKIYFYAKNGFVYIDSSSYHNTKNRVSKMLDSIATTQSFGKKTNQFINYLQVHLKNDEGLGLLISPLMIFEVYYCSEVYKKFRITTSGNAENVLNKKLFTGSIDKEWKSTSKDSVVRLEYFFTGNPTEAANYFKPICEELLLRANIKIKKNMLPAEMIYISNYTFTTQPAKSFPKEMYKKTVSEYLFRTVSKIEMKEIFND